MTEFSKLRNWMGGLLVLGLCSAGAVENRKPVVKDGMVIRTAQQDAELRDWIVGLQTENRVNGERAVQAEESEKMVRVKLGEGNVRADKLQLKVNDVAEDRNRQAKLKDTAMGERDYWHEKEGKAVKKLWWWRIWGGGAIAFGVLLIAGGLLVRFTKWGANTIGPVVRPFLTKAA